MSLDAVIGVHLLKTFGITWKLFAIVAHLKIVFGDSTVVLDNKPCQIS